MELSTTPAFGEPPLYFELFLRILLFIYKIEMDNNDDKMNDINEALDVDLNTIAQYTGSRANAVRNFIAANNLDAAKLANDLSNDQKTQRKNFALAIVGKARTEYLEQLKTKYSLNENREPLNFWHSKYGQIILNLNKENRFDHDLIRQYLLSLISNGVPEWRRELNRIAMDININPQEFETFTQQINAMAERLEAEFEIYITTPCLTKGKLNEVIDKVLGVHFDQEIQSDAKPKRFKITLAQLEKLIPVIITNRKAKNDLQNANK
jgi:hypothetical protein